MLAATDKTAGRQSEGDWERAVPVVRGSNLFKTAVAPTLVGFVTTRFRP
jgi:hypothetical protein